MRSKPAQDARPSTYWDRPGAQIPFAEGRLEAIMRARRRARLGSYLCFGTRSERRAFASARAKAREPTVQMANPFFTIGHSTRPSDEFAALLSAADVRLVVDVRTVPRSRTNPQFNRDVLPAFLASHEIAYEHLASLGGLRGARCDVPSAVNAFWENASFHNYADYAMGPEFHGGLMRLRELGHETRSAVMCAEAVWWRCHRRIIADYLTAAGEDVLHILSSGRVDPARLTPVARPGPDGALTYPKESDDNPGAAIADAAPGL